MAKALSELPTDRAKRARYKQKDDLEPVEVWDDHRDDEQQELHSRRWREREQRTDSLRDITELGKETALDVENQPSKGENKEIKNSSLRHRSLISTSSSRLRIYAVALLTWLANVKYFGSLESHLRSTKAKGKATSGTHANNLSLTKSTVQSVYHQYQSLDHLQEKSLDLLQENLVGGPHQCGVHKCLFPLKTDPRMGYLVQSGKDFLRGFSDAFIASKIIEEKYGMNHMYLAPPKIMSVSLDFREWMEINMTSYPGRKFFPKFTEHPEVTVQAVAILPEEDSSLLGIGAWHDHRRKNGVKRLEEMFTPKKNESWNITDVEIAVKRDFALLYRLVENEEGLPCLCHDFQIFLLRSGHLVHLDVERCFETANLMRKRCVPQLQELETLVLNRLQRSRSEQEQLRIQTNHL